MDNNDKIVIASFLRKKLNELLGENTLLDMEENSISGANSLMEVIVNIRKTSELYHKKCLVSAKMEMLEEMMDFVEKQ
jgi:hypothetical protein